MRRCFALALLLLSPGILPADQKAPADQSASADQKKDDEIYDKVRLRLAGDPDVKGGALDVTVSGGTVTLKGTVRNDKAKAKAERLAGKVKGVTKVVNELKISPTGQ